MSMSVTVTIYVIECLPTGRKYVGSAKRHKVRWGDHRRELSERRHINSYLQKAWRKYGAENFTFTIIETCNVENRWHREQHWIDHYKSANPTFGFNLIPSVSHLPSSSVMSKKLKAYWKKRWKDPEYAAKRTEQLRGLCKLPGVHARMSASKKANWDDPVYRELQSRKHKEHAKKPVNKKRLSNAAKAMWADPEYCAKQLADRAMRKYRTDVKWGRKPKVIKEAHNEIV